MRRVRLAVVGTGDVAHRDYLPEAHRLSDRAELVAICGRDQSRARETAERFGIPDWYTDVAEMLRSASFDALINLASHDAHFEVSLAALRAGKHLYSEKPLALTSDRARILRGEAEARGLVLVAAPSVLVFPQVLRARAIVDAGGIGPVYSARGRSLSGVPPWPGFLGDARHYFAPEVGPLADLAVYPLHALTGILGPARRVTAMARRTRSEFTVSEGPRAGSSVPVAVEDDWHLILECGRALVSIEANYCAGAQVGPECELMGESGAIGFSLFDPAAPLSLVEPGGNRREEEVPHQRAVGPDHILGVKHLVDCVLEGHEVALSAAHAIHVIEIVEAARRSAAAGTAVGVPSAGLT